MLASSVDTHLFWITSRAAGSLALILASLSVGFGLLMATKLIKGKGPDLRVIHEALSLGTMAALVVHAGALLFDGFIRMSVLDVTVPFVSSYHRFWTSTGIIAGWAIVLLGLSFYARDRVGRKRWRSLHRFTAIAWLFGVAHSLGEGTDAGQIWFLASMAIVIAPALGLLAARWAPLESPTPTPETR